VQCSVNECPRLSSKRGMCNAHYLRQRRHGDVYASTPIRPLRDPVCAVPECGKPHSALGYCDTHVQRFRIWGNPFTPPPRARFACDVGGCDEQRASPGLCQSHAARKRRHGDPTVVKVVKTTYRIDPDAVCSTPDCGSPVRRRGLCDNHYQKQRRAEDPETFRLRKLTRRAREANAPGGGYSVSDLAGRMAMWGNKCWMCGGSFDHVDHVKPLAKGGSNHLSNLRPACKSCNSTKSAKWYGVANLPRFLRVPQAA